MVASWEWLLRVWNHEDTAITGRRRHEYSDRAQPRSEPFVGRARTQPPEAVIRHYINDEGGPLIYPSITEAQQRSFDATCRKLHRFLGVPGAAE